MAFVRLAGCPAARSGSTPPSCVSHFSALGRNGRAGRAALWCPKATLRAHLATYHALYSCFRHRRMAKTSRGCPPLCCASRFCLNASHCKTMLHPQIELPRISFGVRSLRRCLPVPGPELVHLRRKSVASAAKALCCQRKQTRKLCAALLMH